MSNGKPDPARLLAGVFQSGQDMMRQFAWAGGSGDGKVDPAAQLISTSQKFVGMQQDLIKQMTGYWSGMMGMATPEQATAGTKDNDRRFAGEAWSNDPRYDLVKRTYLAYLSFWQQIVESAPADEKTKAKLRYDMRQFVDAMSPSNFLATNPEAMQLAVETGGQSIAQGMKLFFDDLAKGRISMSDESAFAIGKNLAATPGAVIYENELIQLIQYSPLTERVYARPLVMIPPCINKYYILDLQPENSLVRYALEQGHTVFIVSWRNVDAEMGHLTWDDYLERV